MYWCTPARRGGNEAVGGIDGRLRCSLGCRDSGDQSLPGSAPATRLHYWLLLCGYRGRSRPGHAGAWPTPRPAGSTIGFGGHGARRRAGSGWSELAPGGCRASLRHDRVRALDRATVAGVQLRIDFRARAGPGLRIDTSTTPLLRTWPARARRGEVVRFEPAGQPWRPDWISGFGGCR